MTDPILSAFMQRLIENPLDVDNRLVLADYLEEHCADEVRPEILRTRRIPMEDSDTLAADRLYGCTFLPGSWDKKFARTLFDLSLKPNGCTPKQYLWLWVLCHRYRRQINHWGVKDEAAKRYDNYCDLLGHTRTTPSRRWYGSRTAKT